MILVPTPRKKQDLAGDEGEKDIDTDLREENIQVEATPHEGPALVSREHRETVGEATVANPRMVCRNVNVYYGDNHAIKDVSLDIGRNQVIAMIGPSGCGKSTFLRCLNRMNDTIEGCRVTGEIFLDDVNIYDEKVDVVPLRAQVGMVFQKPNPFPKSIYKNVSYGPRLIGIRNKSELDDLVDALITCVSPMDGTRSPGLADFLKNLPQRFNDLLYGTKTLPNGNQVADGKLMGWVYKLKSIEDESPIAAFYRDLMMFGRQDGDHVKINKTAAAINYWLNNERNDLPLAITQMSFDSYNIPITEDGTLPVKLFGRKLNLKRLKQKKIPWLICYGENDDLVEKETALAPIDYIDAEVTAFPKGHVAIATSWSHPNSACALHTRFGDKNYRGPVRYQLDLDADLSRSTA